jgi:hypothetical protein
MARAIALTLAVCFLGGGVASIGAADKLTHTDPANPFWPDATSAKLLTPEWIGEDGVEAAVVLAIDDMRDPAIYEALDRRAGAGEHHDLRGETGPPAARRLAWRGTES